MGEPTENDTAAFNSGFDYIKRLTAIENLIANAMMNDDYNIWNKGLDIFWIDLYGWIRKDKKDLEEHDTARQAQRVAADRIFTAFKNKQTSISTNDIELFKMRTMLLKDVMFKYNIRMPKVDDQGDVSILSRKPIPNYRRY
jgi:hypothetical protein